MKVLVFGKNGQVARELQRRAGDDVKLDALDRAAADLLNPEECAKSIIDARPDVVINAAAYTAVDAAETDEPNATTINGRAPAAMAGATAQLGIPLVHISTDYVFDGSGDQPWTTGATTNPLGAYGRTKLAGEVGIRKADTVHCILRTSWVFSAHGANFVKTMLRLGQERDGLSVVADQIGGPTAAADIADACLLVAKRLLEVPDLSGTYHFSGAPDTSWAGFAREIFRQAGLQCAVTDIPSSHYPTPARRPENSRLDCSATERAFGLRRPDWTTSLGRVLTELGAA